MVVLPLGIAWLSAALLAFLDSRQRQVGWLAAVLVAGTLAASLWLGAVVLQSGTQEVVTGGWPVGVGIRLRADLFGVTFAVLSQGVLLAALVYEVIGGVQERFFTAVVLLATAGLTGLFLTGDVFNFYVFFEISMTASFVITSYRQTQTAMRAALMFTVVNLIGSTIFLTAVAALYRVTGTLDMQQIAAQMNEVAAAPALLIGTLIFAAFSIKLGLFPFHFWLPLVYRDTQPAVAAILSGAIANIGAYGLLRFGADMMPQVRETGALVLVVLGAGSILYGAYQAVAARPSSEMLAYSSVSQAGYILVALGIGGTVGFAAVVIYAVINAMNKTLLFLATGLRGWLVGAAFVIGAFSVAGVPPSAGFFGKAAIFRVSLAAESIALVVLIFVGGALAFVYMFQSYQRDYWAAETGSEEGAHATSPLGSRLLVSALAVLVVAVGVWPQPLLAVSEQIAGALRGAGL
jgi:multicomponent Na+:H+ antiporter subunit D